VARARTPKHQHASLSEYLSAKYRSACENLAGKSIWIVLGDDRVNIYQFGALLSRYRRAIAWLNLQLHFAKASLDPDDLVGSLTVAPLSTACKAIAQVYGREQASRA